MRTLHLIVRGSLMWVTLGLVFGTTAGQGQTDDQWQYEGEVFGGLGFSGFYHGDDHAFTGLDLSGGIGLRPFKGALSGLGFESRFSYLNSGADEYGNITRLSGDVLYHFGDSRIQPFILGGIGNLWGERTITVLYGSGPDNFNSEYYQDVLSKFGIEIGAGLKIALGDRLSLRPEFRYFDTTPGSGYNLGLPQLSVAVGYHW